MVRLKSAATSMLRLPPGIFTVTGLFTNPIRTAALAAAQEEDPEAWVSPAPRSQIRMKSSLGPVGTASCTFVRFGNREWFSNAGPNFRRSSRDQDCPTGLKRTQWGFPTLTPVKVRDWPAASMGCSISSLAVRIQGSAAGWRRHGAPMRRGRQPQRGGGSDARRPGLPRSHAPPKAFPLVWRRTLPAELRRPATGFPAWRELACPPCPQ